MLTNKILLQNFLPSFEKTKFWKICFWKNKFLEKPFLFRKRIFIKIKFKSFLVLIYDHTLVFISPRTLFCIYQSKEFLWKFLSSKSPFKNLTFGLVRSTTRSTVGRAELLYRSTGRSTDMHHCACVHFGRPTGRPRTRAMLSVFLGRPDRSTDRENSLSVWDFGRPARSTDSSQNLLTDSNSYFFWFDFLLGSSPTNLLAFFTQFSSLINRGSVLQLKNKIYKLKLKSFQKFSLLAKSFHWAKFSIFLAWSLPLLLF